MDTNRREFLSISAAGTLCGSVATSAFAGISNLSPYEAVVFDAFPIFDPRPIAATAESLFPGQGPALMNAWRTRQFEYQWLRALAGQYTDFMSATRDGLVFASRQLKIEMKPDQQDRLMAKWSELQVWPDVPESVATLRKAGLRLAFLSNMTTEMLTDGLKRAKLEPQFEAVISTDKIRSYKPDPRAYQLAVDTLGLKKDRILFVAFAGWDAAGAKWFGYPTFWTNRANAPAEELGTAPDGVGPDLGALVRFISSR